MFLRRAGTIILALSIILWALATYPTSEPAPGATSEAAQEQQLASSFLGQAGRAIEPVVRPLGFDWKIGVSIISSFAAREVFVATMGTIYGVGSDADETSGALRDRLRTERDDSGALVYTPLIAVGLMVFYVFAMMCVSTNAVVVRETGGGWTGLKWAVFQFAWMFVLAYGAAFAVYRAGLALGFTG
jgi:ferrous iron transport protein B